MAPFAGKRSPFKERFTEIFQDREAVFPTRQSLGAMKNKLKGAETGHSLLKRKSEALTKYVMGIYQERNPLLTLETLAHRRFRGMHDELKL